jgi:prefoldin subunit 5
MEEQQNHLAQLIEQRNKLSSELETLGSQSARTRDLLLKTQGAIEYLNAIGVNVPETMEDSEQETEEQLETEN